MIPRWYTLNYVLILYLLTLTHFLTTCKYNTKFDNISNFVPNHVKFVQILYQKVLLTILNTRAAEYKVHIKYILFFINFSKYFTFNNVLPSRHNMFKYKTVVRIDLVIAKIQYFYGENKKPVSMNSISSDFFFVFVVVFS